MPARMSRVLLATIFVIGAMGLGAPPLHAGSGSVQITDFAFSPNALTVQAPGTITWTNQDGVGHTATSNTGAFNSGTLNSGASYSVTLVVPGTYSYFCAIHAFMTGSINISPAPGRDLVIQSIAVTDLDVTAKQITVTVRNIGSEAAGASQTQLGYLYKGSFRLFTSQNTPALASNATHSFTYFWDTLGKIGNFTLRAIADSADQVSETNETNNTSETNTGVITSAVPGTDLREP